MVCSQELSRHGTFPFSLQNFRPAPKKSASNEPSKLHISLVLDEGGMPRNVSMVDQLGVKVCMSRSIKSKSLQLAIFMALIGIEESGIVSFNLRLD